MNAGYWQGRRVFLTGHTGFKGGWLSIMLKMLGADVCGYALSPETEINLFTEARVDRGMQSIIADITDFSVLQRAIAEFKPDTVFHLAAQAIVSESYKSPLENYNTNIMGTVNLLEAVRQQGTVESVVIVTSDKCYENNETSESYKEGDALGGKDPYSSSKACAELVTAAYRTSFFQHEQCDTAIATARAGNVIGGGDWSQNRLIPDIMRAFSKGESVAIRNPDSIRPWQHVLEPLFGYLLLAEKIVSQEDCRQAWNFGPEHNDIKSVSWIVEQLVTVWGGVQWRADVDSSDFKEAKTLKLNSSKAQEKLGWSPRTRLSDALELTANWYKAFAAGEDPEAVTKAQINSFIERS